MHENSLNIVKADRPILSSPLLILNTVVLIASVGLNVLLAYRLQRQDSSIVAKRAENMLNVGVTVPPIPAKRWGDDRQEVISFSDTNRPTVLYIFTPPCSWCKRNNDNFNALVAQKSEQYRFIGLSLSKDGLGDYITTHHLTIPIYADLSKDTIASYKLGGTPQTLVISPQSTVVKNWKGAYTGGQESEVESFFQVKLPGLRTDSQQQ